VGRGTRRDHGEDDGDRKESGPDAAYFVGSSKHGNEQAFLLRKFVSLWARTIAITRPHLHSTTVAGVANTWATAL